MTHFFVVTGTSSRRGARPESKAVLTLAAARSVERMYQRRGMIVTIRTSAEVSKDYRALEARYAREKKERTQ